MQTGSPRTVPLRRHQRGFGFLLVLFAIAALGLLAAGAGEVWQTTTAREREAQLLFVGHEYRNALASYYALNVNGQHEYPRQLEDLLEDRRLPVLHRHLRRLYPDPVTGAMDWVLIKGGDRITALHSRSPASSLRIVFGPPDEVFNGASTYEQWLFKPDLQGPKS